MQYPIRKQFRKAKMFHSKHVTVGATKLYKFQRMNTVVDQSSFCRLLEALFLVIPISKQFESIWSFYLIGH